MPSPCNLFPPVLFSSVPYGDQDAFADWNGHHMLWHKAMAELTHTRFVLIDDIRRELLRHSEMHDAVDLALGIPPPYDLLSFDLFDRESYYGFMALHGNETQRQRVALGI